MSLQKYVCWSFSLFIVLSKSFCLPATRLRPRQFLFSHSLFCNLRSEENKESETLSEFVIFNRFSGQQLKNFAEDSIQGHCASMKKVILLRAGGVWVANIFERFDLMSAVDTNSRPQQREVPMFGGEFPGISRHGWGHPRCINDVFYAVVTSLKRNHSKSLKHGGILGQTLKFRLKKGSTL